MAKKEAEVASTEPLVAIKRDQYQKAKSPTGGASLNNGDLVASGILGLEIDDIVAIAEKMGVAKPAKGETPAEDLSTKYAHLNVGMQRMNLGNRLRGRIAKIDTLNEKGEGKEGFKPTKSGEDQFTAVISPFRKAADKRIADAEKEAAAKAKAAEKEAAAKAKAEKPAKKGKAA